MTDVVIAHGGTINEFIGDAVFAVFGAPLAHPDHAERAAARARHAGGDGGDQPPARRGAACPAFEMGIGVHTGEAVVGNIGSEQRAKYAVVGSAVNVATRVEGATVGGQVLLTARTLSELGSLGRVGRAGSHPGEGPLRAPDRPRASGPRGPIRARAPRRPGGSEAAGVRRPRAGMLGDRWQDRPRRYPSTGRVVSLEGREMFAELRRGPRPADQREAEAPVPGPGFASLRGHLRKGAGPGRRGPRAAAPHSRRSSRRAGDRQVACLDPSVPAVRRFDTPVTPWPGTREKLEADRGRG